MAVFQREAAEGPGEGPGRRIGPMSSTWRMTLSGGVLQGSLYLCEAGVLLNRLHPLGV